MKKIFILILLPISSLAFSQDMIEAEIDTSYQYQFNPVQYKHMKSILIDAAHNTIYSNPTGKITSREMFRIIDADGFNVQFTKQTLSPSYIDSINPDLLIIQGMPNDRIILKNELHDEVMYLSPLKDTEVKAIGEYVFNGGGLLLFLSHFPGGSGALPLLEAFNVKFRDGYAYQGKYHTSKPGNCGHFLMNESNKMLNKNHPVFISSLDNSTIPDNVRFYCGAAIFRNPEDNILPFPDNTINYTPTSNKQYLEESSNYYAGMIGFKFGSGRVIISTDQGIFRSLNLIQNGEKVAVTIHDPHSENAGLLLNILRWLTKLQ